MRNIGVIVLSASCHLPLPPFFCCIFFNRIDVAHELTAGAWQSSSRKRQMTAVGKDNALVFYLCTPYHCHQLIHIIRCCKILILCGSEDEFGWILLFHAKIIFFIIIIIFRQTVAKILIHYKNIYCIDLDIF